MVSSPSSMFKHTKAKNPRISLFAAMMSYGTNPKEKYSERNHELREDLARMNLKPQGVDKKWEHPVLSDTASMFSKTHVPSPKLREPKPVKKPKLKKIAGATGTASFFNPEGTLTKDEIIEQKKAPETTKAVSINSQQIHAAEEVSLLRDDRKNNSQPSINVESVEEVKVLPKAATEEEPLILSGRDNNTLPQPMPMT